MRICTGTILTNWYRFMGCFQPTWHNRAKTCFLHIKSRKKIEITVITSGTFTMQRICVKLGKSKKEREKQRKKNLWGYSLSSPSKKNDICISKSFLIIQEYYHTLDEITKSSSYWLKYSNFLSCTCTCFKICFSTQMPPPLLEKGL